MSRRKGAVVRDEVRREDAEWILSKIDVSGLESISPLDGGWDNCNVHLKLADSSQYVLKAWFANSIEEVGRVVERHLHLHAHGIPTTVPIQLEDGVFLVEKDGFAWTLLPFVEGGFLDSDEFSLRSLGEVLARMHLIPTAGCFPREYRMGFSLFEKVIGHCKEDGRVPFIDLLTDEFGRLRRSIPDSLPSGILHGDLFPDNVIGSGGSVSAILDLEESWIGPMCFDLVMAFVGFGWEGAEPIDLRWRALVDGYQRVRSLNSEEISVIPQMHRYATLAIACWRFWKHNLSVPDQELSGRYLEMVERLAVDYDLTEALR